MKKVMTTLSWLLVITTFLTAAIGGYLKYCVLEPLGLAADSSLMEVPFLLLADDGLRFSLKYAAKKEAEPPETQPPETDPTETTQATETQTEPTETAEPETEPPETEPIVIEVDETWFDDVLFIGDSRTVGMRDYARLGKADYFCGIGMSFFSMFDFFEEDQGFSGCYLEDLLSRKSYGKIYIALGINGSGTPYEVIDAAMAEAIERIRELQPDAKIILHGIIGVGRWKENQAWYFSNEHLYTINQLMKLYADDETIYYIDANSWMTDEYGYLSNEYCDEDQCHLTVKGYSAWAQWILDSAGDLGIP